MRGSPSRFTRGKTSPPFELCGRDSTTRRPPPRPKRIKKRSVKMPNTSAPSTKYCTSIVAQEAHVRVHAPSAQPRHSRGRAEAVQWPFRGPLPPSPDDPISKTHTRTAFSPSEDQTAQPLDQGPINGVCDVNNKALSHTFQPKPALTYNRKNNSVHPTLQEPKQHTRSIANSAGRRPTKQRALVMGMLLWLTMPAAAAEAGARRQALPLKSNP